MFLIHSARSEDGRRAMKAYRNYKKIALGTESKIHVLQDLLVRHKHDKVLIFTAENEMVYRISNDYLIPAITHETNVKERKFWLDAFNNGDVLALATSKKASISPTPRSRSSFPGPARAANISSASAASCAKKTINRRFSTKS
jgi:hypothetical protein